jgi:hypothetical protein
LAGIETGGSERWVEPSVERNVPHRPTKAFVPGYREGDPARIQIECCAFSTVRPRLRRHPPSAQIKDEGELGGEPVAGFGHAHHQLASE